MRSGTGRHRRPRQIPAVVVAAGVTGAGIAMPLFAATGATAADAATWDRVAQCESGGLWSADNGDGFYGGLQMTRQMWEANGGTSYAPQPDMASRAQQIAVAERILQARGPYAWPSCAVGSGLAAHGPTPEVNPGSTQAPEPEPAHRAEPGHPAPAPSSSASGTPNPDGASGSGASKPGKSTPERPAQQPAEQQGDQPEGKHRKPPAADPVTPPAGTPSADPAPAQGHTPGGTGADPGGSAPSDPGAGAGAGAGTGKHRAEPPRSGADRASRGGTEARTGTPEAGDYTVRPGDNLSAIAQEKSVEGGWHKLYRDNQKAVGSDPDLIHPGQQLELKK